MHDLQLYPPAPKPPTHNIACFLQYRSIQSHYLLKFVWAVSKIHLKDGPSFGAPSPALFPLRQSATFPPMTEKSGAHSVVVAPFMHILYLWVHFL